MPRGVPKKGFRATRARQERGLTNPAFMAAPAVVREETEAEIRAKLTERFGVLESVVKMAIAGTARAVIISGPAGLGKSYGVTKALEDYSKKHDLYHTIIRGSLRATGLYKTLHEYRQLGSVIVFDDADDVFADETSLNLLKTACDMTRTRRLSWLSETKMEDDGGDRLPRSFEFEGTVIFITNLDFDTFIERQNRLAPHFAAMISRALYLDLAMKTKKDYMTRIKMVVEEGMLRDLGLTAADEGVILAWLDKHQDRLRELSLRMVVKVAAMMLGDRVGWERTARITCCRNA